MGEDTHHLCSLGQPAEYTPSMSCLGPVVLGIPRHVLLDGYFRAGIAAMAEAKTWGAAQALDGSARRRRRRGNLSRRAELIDGKEV